MNDQKLREFQLLVKNSHATPLAHAHPFVPALLGVSAFFACSSFLAAVREILPAVFAAFILIGAAFNRSAYLPPGGLKIRFGYRLFAFCPAHIRFSSPPSWLLTSSPKSKSFEFSLKYL
ncbi:MAG: hypothetical protein P8X68_20395 [Desulfobacterales bacterium]|jgi:hypothetical protein